jgi:polygalacturonase
MGKSIKKSYNEDILNLSAKILSATGELKMQTIFKANEYGAVPDGKTLCTSAIQSAVDDAAAHGGGRVVFEKGGYLTGTVFVKSNVEFEIGEGVTLFGAQDGSAYPELRNRVAGVEMTWPLGILTVFSQENVRIFGGGTINGQGEYWWEKYWGKDRRGGLRKIYDAKSLRWAADYDCKRPRNIVVFNSAHVTIENLRIKRSGFWNIHICYSDQIQIRNLDISENYGPSTDGIDLDSSSNVKVESCRIACSDDNICIKSGRDGDGLRVGRPCENIEVCRCETGTGDGITLGSETSGGMRNIKISDIRMNGTNNGIRMKSARIRGGLVQNICFSHFEMKDVANIFNFELDWYPAYSYCCLPEGWSGEIPNRWKSLLIPVDPPERGIPEFRDISISDIHAETSKACTSQLFSVNAYPQKPIRNVSFQNIAAETTTAGTIRYAKDWFFKNTDFHFSDGSKIKIENCSNLNF